MEGFNREIQSRTFFLRSVAVALKELIDFYASGNFEKCDKN